MFDWVERWQADPSLSWVLALIAVSGSLAGFVTLKRILVSRLRVWSERTATDLDDLAADLTERTHLLSLTALSLYVGAEMVDLSDKLEHYLGKFLVVVGAWQVALWGNHLIGYWLKRYVRPDVASQTDAASKTTVSVLGFLARMALYVAILLMALDNLGVEITTLVAGLGIGGIAVALAAQNILGDLFASLTIAFDQPFLIGDFINLGEHWGTVEYIGLKTTRIRSLGGEQLVFSNTDLLGSRIRNFQRMTERRAVFHFTVAYTTSYEKLSRVAGLVRSIIAAKEKVRFDRAHFKEYGVHGLVFEVVYWVLDPDFMVFMDIQQQINLELFRRFEQEGIPFALPVQNLYVSQGALGPPVATR